MNDIKEQKGRTKRKVFKNNFRQISDLKNDQYAKSRIEKGDPEFTKFLVAKERNLGHH